MSTFLQNCLRNNWTVPSRLTAMPMMLGLITLGGLAVGSKQAIAISVPPTIPSPLSSPQRSSTRPQTVHHQTAQQQIIAQQPAADPSASSKPGLLRQAQTALRQERYEEAEVLWRQLAHQWPNSAEMSYSLGMTLHRQFKIEEAAQAYVTATVLNPKHREAHINLSLARIQLGQLDEALIPLNQVLSLPDQPSRPASIHTLAHYNQAVVWGRQKKLDEARQAVDKALLITPDFRQAQELIDLIR